MPAYGLNIIDNNSVLQAAIISSSRAGSQNEISLSFLVLAGVPWHQCHILLQSVPWKRSLSLCSFEQQSISERPCQENLGIDEENCCHDSRDCTSELGQSLRTHAGCCAFRWGVRQKAWVTTRIAESLAVSSKDAVSHSCPVGAGWISGATPSIHCPSYPGT